MEKEKTWDVFISHASEDKERFVRHLAVALQSLGVSVWYDEFSLMPGDSLSRSLDKGLIESNYGLVVISPHFIKKPWPEYELRGLVAREIDEDKVILPIWLGIDRADVVKFSPTLADKIAITTEHLDANEVSLKVLRVIRPDIYKSHPRTELQKIANGQALTELQHELERSKKELKDAQKQLSEYQCPICEAPLSNRVEAPADPGEKYWGTRETYDCGYQNFDGQTERPCPSDPNFPTFESYNLNTHLKSHIISGNAKHGLKQIWQDCLDYQLVLEKQNRKQKIKYMKIICIIHINTAHNKIRH